MLAESVALSAALNAFDPPAAATDAASAAPPASPEDRWKFSLTPYLWLAAMSGDMTIRGRNFSVDLGLSQTVDLLQDNLNMALAFHLEAQHDHLCFFGDAMYLGLEGNRRGQLATQKLTIDEGIFELGFAWADTQPQISEGGAPQLRIEPLGGVRIWWLQGHAEGSAGLLNIRGEESWVDAFAGARCTLELAPCFSLFARGDVGTGGANFTWNAMAGVEWNPCQPVGVIAGFRGLYVNYATGSGNDRFAYDMLLWGPFMALQIRF